MEAEKLSKLSSKKNKKTNQKSREKGGFLNNLKPVME
jgi:hypothetical protein